MFSSEKASENQLLESLELAVFTSSAYFFGQSLLILQNQISLFDWIQISNFKVDFGFY
jgi:hypothetical protein